jgi:hypothetical protein
MYHPGLTHILQSCNSCSLGGEGDLVPFALPYSPGYRHHPPASEFATPRSSNRRHAAPELRSGASGLISTVLPSPCQCRCGSRAAEPSCLRLLHRRPCGASTATGLTYRTTAVTLTAKQSDQSRRRLSKTPQRDPADAYPRHRNKASGSRPSPPRMRVPGCGPSHQRPRGHKPLHRASRGWQGKMLHPERHTRGLSRAPRETRPRWKPRRTRPTTIRWSTARPRSIGAA